MNLYEDEDEWLGRSVVAWTPDEPAEPIEAGVAYSIGMDWDADGTWADRWAEFLARPGASSLSALLVGPWGDVVDGTEAAGDVVEAIVGAREKLPNLQAIFFGNISQEECEISWISQTDLSPLFGAFPKLEHFGARGGQNLSLGMPRHAHLRSLVVEAGGLPVSVLHEIRDAHLPALEHLQIWLGTAGYGGTTTVEEAAALLQGAPNKWPHLTYLGLRNCDYADALAQMLAENGGHPVLSHIDTLDLSLGTLGDAGVNALVSCPAVKKLKKIDMHHHYARAENIARLTASGVEVDASDAQDEDKYGRYVAVGE